MDIMFDPGLNLEIDAGFDPGLNAIEHPTKQKTAKTFISILFISIINTDPETCTFFSPFFQFPGCEKFLEELGV